jgi:hypothetical protein
VKWDRGYHFTTRKMNTGWFGMCTGFEQACCVIFGLLWCNNICRCRHSGLLCMRTVFMHLLMSVYLLKALASRLGLFTMFSLRRLIKDLHTRWCGAADWFWRLIAVAVFYIIFGPAKERDGTWRIKTNNELNKLIKNRTTYNELYQITKVRLVWAFI